MIHRDNDRMLRSAFSAITGRSAPGPFYHKLLWLAELERSLGFRDVCFYFRADNVEYRIGDPVVKAAAQKVRSMGFSVGIHPGYATHLNRRALLAEKKRFEDALGEEPEQSRQHYLRFKAPDTWAALDDIGISSDSTLGYAEQEGFRCGTAHPFRPFNAQKQQTHRLIELPLIAMDATLVGYRSLAPDEVVNRVRLLHERAVRVGGTFTLLIHNGSFGAQWTHYETSFSLLLGELAKS